MTTTVVVTDTPRAHQRLRTAPTREHAVTTTTVDEHLHEARAAHARTGFHALAPAETAAWVDAVVRELRAGRTPADVDVEQLQAAGIDASTPTKWEATRARAWPLLLQELRWWIDTHGSANVPQNATSRDVDGVPYPLGKRTHQARNDYRLGKLAPERVAELEQLPGWAWDPRNAQWQDSADQIKAHYRAHHTLEGLPEPLQRWVARQRRAQLTDAQRTQLEAIPGALVDRRRRAGAFVVAARGWLQAQPAGTTMAGLPSSATVHLRPRADVDLGTPGDDGLIAYPVGKRATFYRRRFHGLETVGDTAAPLHPDDVEAIEALPGWSWELDPIKSANRRRNRAAQASA